MEGSFEAQWQSCGRPGFSSENSSTSLLFVAECADPMTTKYVRMNERTARSGVSFSYINNRLWNTLSGGSTKRGPSKSNQTYNSCYSQTPFVSRANNEIRLQESVPARRRSV